MPYPSRNRGFGSPFPNSLPNGVKWLLITNVALFILYFFSAGTRAEDFFKPLGLIPRSVIESFAVWQLVTYMFLHSPYDFWHILFNMLALWMFGVTLERHWGTRRFLQYYFLCGVGAGICVVVANLLFGSLDTRTIGASGAIYGLLLAFGVLFPNTTVLFAFLFPIKAKYFVMILGAIAFLSSARASGGQVSHVAHLGGMVFGLAYLNSKGWNLDIGGMLRRRHRDWKFRRAKKKFQVYLKKQNSKHDHSIQ
jgi:membrane associated rhomboid family serine protease